MPSARTKPPPKLVVPVPAPKKKPPAPPELRQLAHAEYHESATNPRKLFRDLGELAEDLRAVGQIEPCIVRPSPTPHVAPFELVIGARRSRGCKLARIPRLWVLVRDLTDEQALQLQVAENNQRQDCHPLEEAEAFRRLHEQHGQSVGDIAAFLGRSEAYVYGRLRLCQLLPAAQKAYLDGQIRHRPALWLARIPQGPLQLQALALLLSLNEGDERPLDREAQKLLLARFTLRLDLAPFRLDDAQLLTQAGACTSCPKRTGNQGELFDDVREKNTCTDPPCFEAKKEASWRRYALAARKEGIAVLDDDEAAQLFPVSSQLGKGAAYVDLDAPAPEDGKGRSYRALLGGKIPQRFVARDPWTQEVRTLLRVEDLPQAMHAAGHQRIAGRIEEPQPEGEEPLTKRERLAYSAAADQALGELERLTASKPAGVAYYRLVLSGLMAGADDSALVELARRRGLFEQADEHGHVAHLRPTKGNAFDALDRAADEMGEQELRGLVFALAVGKDAHDRDRQAQVFVRACRAYGVGFPGLLLAARAEVGLVEVQPGELPVKMAEPPPRCRCCYAGLEHGAVFVERDLCRVCRKLGVEIERAVANELAPTRAQDEVVEFVAREQGAQITRTTSCFLDRLRMGRLYPDVGNKGLVRTVRLPERKAGRRRAAGT